MLRVAILGFGFVGKRHADAYVQLPNVRLVAIGGCTQERLQEWKAPYDVPFYSDAEVLLESCGADILDICLPTFMHEEFVTKAAARGVHVICEKPLALTVMEVDRMLMAVRKAGITFMVAQVLRFFGHYSKCASLVRDGSLGKVFFASACRLAEPPRWAKWFQDPAKSGGALFDLQVHDLDYLINLFGIPDRLFAAGLQSETGCWDHVLNVLSYREMQACVEVSYCMPTGRPFTSALRLVGKAGTIEYGFRVSGNVDVIERAQHSLVLYPQACSAVPLTAEESDPYLAEVKYFVDAVEQRRKIDLISTEQVRSVIAVLEATKVSLETGRVVELGHLDRTSASLSNGSEW